MNCKPLLLAALALTLAGCASKNDFWTVCNGHFHRGNDPKPAYYIGTNLWYGPLLLSDTQAADPQRLAEELDYLKSIGITNLRVLVGADGQAGVKSKIEPTLQTEPGVYDENVLVGLDRFLAELGKRSMTAVLYINNAWEWSGGFGQYLQWAGEGRPRSTVDDPWPDYCAHTSQFVVNAKAKAMFAQHLQNIVSRVNTVTGKPYKDDPAIFSWQICNEPRFFVSTPELKAAFTDWLCESAALIKSIDPNHMVSSGSEGSWGCEGDMDVFRKVHACPDIDYLTIHIWPFNWSWARRDSLKEDLPEALRKTDEYIDVHIAVARELGKPLVLEEFGFPRDAFQFRKGTPTTLRDAFYAHIFDRVAQSAERKDVFAGVNFWTWGGLARQSETNIYWQKGDDYCGDPAQEQQGLNSVYTSDGSTMEVIRKACDKLN
jgi:mannan endo-1,4-beta-mannosidase